MYMYCCVCVVSVVQSDFCLLYLTNLHCKFSPIDLSIFFLLPNIYRTCLQACLAWRTFFAYSVSDEVWFQLFILRKCMPECTNCILWKKQGHGMTELFEICSNHTVVRNFCCIRLSDCEPVSFYVILISQFYFTRPEV